MQKVRRLVIFLSIIIGVLSLGVVVVYQGVRLALSLHNPSLLLYLAVGLGLCTASFILSTAIGNYYYNAFTRAYYIVSVIWIGFFTYLFLASLVYGLIVALFPALVAVGPALLLGAVLLSIYGLVHTQKLIIRNVEVTLPNLPESWKGRRAVWISDIHFGQLYGATFARKIVAHIAPLAPDIIFVGGDLYDGTSAPDMLKLTAPLKDLSAKFGVYFITGNHEEYGDLQKFLTAVESVGMRILKDEVLDVDGLQLIGVDFRSTSDGEHFKQVLSSLTINRNVASLLLKHEPKHLEVAEAAGISLQISGHTHDAQLWPLTYLGRYIHKGFAYGLQRFQNLQIYTSSGTGTWGPPMRVGTDSEIVLFTFL